MKLKQLLEISKNITQVIIDFDGCDNIFTTSNGFLEDWLYGWEDYDKPYFLMEELMNYNVVSIDIANKYELIIILKEND